MAELGRNFDPTEHSTEQSDFSNLPDGVYSLEVVASDTVEDGQNFAVKVTYAVLEPEAYNGRYVFDWFDLEHTDAAFKERGNRNFSRLCRAIGYNKDVEGPINNSEILHFRAFTAKVKDNPAGVSKAGKPFRAKNSIGLFYYPDEGNAPEIGVIAGGKAPSAAPANDNRPAAKPSAAAPAKKNPWAK